MGASSLGIRTLSLIKAAKKRSRLSIETIADRLMLSVEEVKLCLNGDGEELNAMADLCRGLGHSPAHFLCVIENCHMSVDKAIARNAAWEMKTQGWTLEGVLDRIKLNSPQANIDLIRILVDGELPRLENIRQIALLVSNPNNGERFSYFVSRAETDIIYPEPETKAA